MPVLPGVLGLRSGGAGVGLYEAAAGADMRKQTTLGTGAQVWGLLVSAREELRSVCEALPEP